jgi:hypothetical protein
MQVEVRILSQNILKRPVHITTKVLSSNPAHGEVYNIQHCVIKFIIILFLVLYNKNCCSWYCTTKVVVLVIVQQKLLFLLLCNKRCCSCYCTTKVVVLVILQQKLFFLLLYNESCCSCYCTLKVVVLGI